MIKKASYMYTKNLLWIYSYKENSKIPRSIPKPIQISGPKRIMRGLDDKDRDARDFSYNLVNNKKKSNDSNLPTAA